MSSHREFDVKLSGATLKRHVSPIMASLEDSLRVVAEVRLQELLDTQLDIRLDRYNTGGHVDRSHRFSYVDSVLIFKI